MQFGNLDEDVHVQLPDHVIQPVSDSHVSFPFSPDLGFAASPVVAAESLQYEPSLASHEHGDDTGIDLGGNSSTKDDAAAVVDQFSRGVRFSAITLP